MSFGRVFLRIIVVPWILISLFGESIGQTMVTPATNPAVSASVHRELLKLTTNNDRPHLLLGIQSMRNPQPWCGILCVQGYSDAGYVRWRLEMRRKDGRVFDHHQFLKLNFHCQVNNNSLQISHRVELEEGELKATSSFLMPVGPSFNNYRDSWRLKCEVEDEERQWPSTTSENYFSFPNQSNPPNVTCNAIFVTDSATVSKFTLGKSKSDVAAILDSGQWLLQEWMIARRELLPTDWRELGGLDLVMIERPTFRALSNEQQTAIRSYATSGGNLMFLGCPEAANDLPKLVDTLRQVFPALENRENDDVVSAIVRVNDARAKFETGFGQVTFSTAYPDASVNPKTWVSVTSQNRSRMERLFDVEHMTWLIPRLGQPPVVMFLFSIMSFTLVAGPVLLWWTGRKLRRPTWLLATFPTLAIAITLSIFLYAVLVDGFELHGRIRSITTYDARTGTSHAYSRQTYFSGFPPSEVTFKTDTDFWIVETEEEKRRYNYDRSPDYELSWNESQQVCRNLLPARTQKQWIATHPLPDFKPFDLKLAADGSTLTLRNLLSSDIRYAVFQLTDHHGFFLSEGVKAGESVSVQVTDQNALVNFSRRPEAIERYERWFSSFTQVANYPPGFSSQGSPSFFRWFSSGYRYPTNQGHMPHLALEDEVLNWTKVNSGRRRFLLEVDRADYLDRPFDDPIQESESSHAILGAW
jgi:hypothetical protein